MKNMSRLVAALIVCAGGVTACGGDDHHGGTNTYNQHACDHLEFGPLVKTTLGDTPATAAEVKVMTDQEVALQASGAGYLKIPAAVTGAGLYGVFVTRSDVTATVEDASQKAIQPSATATSIPQCATVKSKAMYTLSAADHFLKLDYPSGASSQPVHVVVVEPGQGRTDD